MSILDAAKKINVWVLAAVCLILAGGLGIGVYQIEAFSAQKQPVVIDSSKVESVPVSAPTGFADPMAFVASKLGKKYHRLNCPGARTIVEQNRIYFGSETEARQAGYEPAANCKGLIPPASE